MEKELLHKYFRGETSPQEEKLIMDWAEASGDGRKQDFIYDIKKRRINITALIFGQHFHAFENIVRWQIIQLEFGKVEIKIITKKRRILAHR